ncbi:tripartite tricarboxylate transporter TctB family protein [Hoeflea marina]|uniref:Tripartite tricarboxylate transporter TctB family protein n=2 Tax=Hoeflea marina TaxID=274592 RepID=A0A317PFZ2_9HYPH|nr:tripartite tricarboxylate transporter TctB family protein [Hoeflea marina]
MPAAAPSTDLKIGTSHPEAEHLMQHSSIFDVTIDFSRSHLIFPTMMAILLCILGLAILATRWRGIAASLRSDGHWPSGIDQPRFFGTLVLILVYFLAMPVVGGLFPNRGFGFLLCSAPFMFALSVLYMHGRDTRKLGIAFLSALIATTLIWYLMASVFNLTLP